MSLKLLKTLVELAVIEKCYFYMDPDSNDVSESMFPKMSGLRLEVENGLIMIEPLLEASPLFKKLLRQLVP